MPGLRDSLATSLQHYLLTIRVFLLWLAQTLFGLQPGGTETPASTPAEQLPLSGADVLAKRRGSPSSPEFAYSPPSPDPAVDLEQGLLSPSTPKLLETPRSNSRQRNHTEEATPGGSHSPRRAPADPSSHLTITSAVLSAYIRDGVGLSLSESAQEMLGLNLRSSTVDEDGQHRHQRKSEWWDATDPLRAQDSFGEAPSTHATFDQESNSRSTPWTTPDLDQGHPHTLSPRIAPLGPNSARASTWAVKSLVVTENDETIPTSTPSFFFHSYPLPAHRPRSPPLSKSRTIGAVADSPTIPHHKDAILTPSIPENDKTGGGAAEPWQNLLLLPAHFINDLHETFASDFDGMSLSLSTPSILRRRRATSVGSSSLQDSVDDDERGCHLSATGSGRDEEQERGLSPSLSAPEPRYYAFYHEFYNCGSGRDSVAASYGVTGRKDASGSSGATRKDHGYVGGDQDQDRLNYGETTKRREKTTDDLVVPTQQQHRPSGITQRRDIIRCSNAFRRLLPATTATTKTTTKARATTTTSKPNVTSRSHAHSTHSARSSDSHYSRSSILSSPYDSTTSSESAAESDMFPSTWCVQPMTRTALRRSFLGSCASTEEEEEQEEQRMRAFLRDEEYEVGHENEEGAEEERQVVEGSMFDVEHGRVLGRDDLELEGLGKPLASVQDGAGAARLSRMPTFIVPLAVGGDASPERESGPRARQLEQAVQRAGESDLGLGGHGKSKQSIGYAQQPVVGLESDADLEGSVATFVSCESFGSRMH